MNVLRESAQSVALGRRGLTATLGLLLGALFGGITFTGFGLVGIVFRVGPNLFWGFCFVLAFVAALLGMVAPMGVFAFLATRQETRARRQVFRMAGFAALFLFYPALGLAGWLVFGYTDLQFGSALNMLVVFDAIGGLTYGGLAGLSLAERRLARTTTPDATLG